MGAEDPNQIHVPLYPVNSNGQTYGAAANGPPVTPYGTTAAPAMNGGYGTGYSAAPLYPTNSPAGNYPPAYAPAYAQYQSQPGVAAPPAVILNFNPPEPRRVGCCRQVLTAPFELRTFGALFYYIFLSLPIYTIGATLILTFAYLCLGFVFMCCVGIPMFAGFAVFIRAYANFQIKVSKTFLPPRDPTLNVMTYPILYGKISQSSPSSWMKSSITSALNWCTLGFYHFLALPWSCLSSGSVMGLYAVAMWCIGTSLFWVLGVSPFEECDGCGGFLKSGASFILLFPVGIVIYWFTCCAALWFAFLERNMLWHILGYRVVDKKDFPRFELVLPPNADAAARVLPMEVVDPTNPQIKAVYTHASIPDVNVRDFGRKGTKSVCCLSCSALFMILFAMAVFAGIWFFNAMLRCQSSTRQNIMSTHVSPPIIYNRTSIPISVVSNIDCPMDIYRNYDDFHVVKVRDDGDAAYDNATIVFTVTISVVKGRGMELSHYFKSQLTGTSLTLDFQNNLSWKERLLLCAKASIVVSVPSQFQYTTQGLSLDVKTVSQGIDVSLTSQWNSNQQWTWFGLVAPQARTRFYTGYYMQGTYSMEVTTTYLDSSSSINTNGSLVLVLNDNRYYYRNYQYLSYKAGSSRISAANSYLQISANFQPFIEGTHEFSTTNGELDFSVYYTKSNNRSQVIAHSTNGRIYGNVYNFEGDFNVKTDSGNLQFQQCGQRISHSSSYDVSGRTEPYKPNSVSVSSTNGNIYYYGSCPNF